MAEYNYLNLLRLTYLSFDSRTLSSLLSQYDLGRRQVFVSFFIAQLLENTSKLTLLNFFKLTIPGLFLIYFRCFSCCLVAFAFSLIMLCWLIKIINWKESQVKKSCLFVNQFLISISFHWWPNILKTLKFLFKNWMLLNDSRSCVLAGEFEAVRSNGIDSRQISSIWYHVPGQGQGDVLVVPEMIQDINEWQTIQTCDYGNHFSRAMDFWVYCNSDVSKETFESVFDKSPKYLGCLSYSCIKRGQFKYQKTRWNTSNKSISRQICVIMIKVILIAIWTWNVR